MGSFIGHVLPGLAFFLLGLWHFFNHIKLHLQRPNSFKSLAWFPTSKSRYLELYFIIAASSISVSMELVIGPRRHHPFAPDGTIPSNHLRNFEHASISLTFIVYAVLAIMLDRISPISHRDLTQLLGAIAFGQQLLLFHVHSSDHMGVEGQFHLLLQLLVLISLISTLLGIGKPRSFIVSFVRSLSILFQGVWMIVMGFMLWIPELVPDGCFINDEGHEVVRCSSDEALHRAKALVNIEFSWFVILITIFAVSFYLCLVRVYGGKAAYWSLVEEEEEERNDVVQSQTKSFAPI